MIMLLKNRIILHKIELNNILHRSCSLDGKRWFHTFAISWALNKGDWWKRSEEDKKRLFHFDFFRKDAAFRRTGIYITRLAIIWQYTKNKKL